MGCTMAKKLLDGKSSPTSSSTATSGSEPNSGPSSSSNRREPTDNRCPLAGVPTNEPGSSSGGGGAGNKGRKVMSGDAINDFSKLKDDPRMPLNVRQIFKITKSWKAIARTMSKTGTAMFLTLFEQNEDILYLFDRFQNLKGRELNESMELREHAETVMATLDNSINLLSDYDNFVTYLHSIGRLHRKIPGFKRAYFWKIEQPFLKAVKQTLDERCNDTIEEIYKTTIKLIIQTIADGYGEDKLEAEPGLTGKPDDDHDYDHDHDHDQHGAGDANKTQQEKEFNSNSPGDAATRPPGASSSNYRPPPSKSHTTDNKRAEGEKYYGDKMVMGAKEPRVPGPVCPFTALSSALTTTPILLLVRQEHKDKAKLSEELEDWCIVGPEETGSSYLTPVRNINTTSLILGTGKYKPAGAEALLQRQAVGFIREIMAENRQQQQPPPPPPQRSGYVFDASRSSETLLKGTLFVLRDLLMSEGVSHEVIDQTAQETTTRDSETHNQDQGFENYRGTSSSQSDEDTLRASQVDRSSEDDGNNDKDEDINCWKQHDTTCSLQRRQSSALDCCFKFFTRTDKYQDDSDKNDDDEIVAQAEIRRPFAGARLSDLSGCTVYVGTPRNRVDQQITDARISGSRNIKRNSLSASSSGTCCNFSSSCTCPSYCSQRQLTVNPGRSLLTKCRCYNNEVSKSSRDDDDNGGGGFSSSAQLGDVQKLSTCCPAVAKQVDEEKENENKKKNENENKNKAGDEGKLDNKNLSILKIKHPSLLLADGKRMSSNELNHHLTSTSDRSQFTDANASANNNKIFNKAQQFLLATDPCDLNKYVKLLKLGVASSNNPTDHTGMAMEQP